MQYGKSYFDIKEGEESTHKDKCEFCQFGEEIPLETEEN